MTNKTIEYKINLLQTKMGGTSISAYSNLHNHYSLDLLSVNFQVILDILRKIIRKWAIRHQQGLTQGKVSHMLLLMEAKTWCCCMATWKVR